MAYYFGNISEIRSFLFKAEITQNQSATESAGRRKY